MYKNLDHLSPEEIEKLKERYYSKDKEKLSNIIKDYELDVRTGELVKLIPDLQLEEKCEHCGTPLKFRYKSRTYYYSADHKKGEPYCPKCGHLPEEKHCKCHICEEMRRQAAELERQRKLQEIQRKKQAIYDAYIGNEPTKDFNDLTLREKILLGTLCHALIDENLAVLRPLEHFSGRIFYSEYAAGYGYEDDAIDIVRELFQSDILAVSFDSPIEAFTEDNFPNRFYLNKVRFKINLKFSDGIAVCIKKLMYPEFDGSSLNGEALSDDDIWYIADMWKKLVLYDSYDFLLYEIDRVGFNFNIGEKTELSFKYMLENFSVAQIYNIVFRAVALASKSYLENGITKKHAANLITGNCVRYAESAVANGWDIKPYNRRSDLEQTVLYEYFFNSLVRIGGLAFSVKNYGRG